MLKYLQSGVEKLNKGEFNEALEDFNQYLSTNPNDTKGLYHRAITHRKLELYKLSLRDFNIALKQHPDDADLLCDRAITYYHMGNKKLALQDMNYAASLEPEKPFRYASRAFIKGKFGDIQGAIEDYEKALELDPDDAVSHNNIGLLQEQLGRASKAKNHFDKADALRKGEKHEIPLEIQKLKDESTPIVKTEKKKSPNRQELTPKKETKKVTGGIYFQTIVKLFTSKKERREFIEFITRLFSKK